MKLHHHDHTQHQFSLMNLVNHKKETIKMNGLDVILLITVTDALFGCHWKADACLSEGKRMVNAVGMLMRAARQNFVKLSAKVKTCNEICTFKEEL